MGHQEKISQLLDKLAETTDGNLTVLKDAGSQDFKERMSRWSDIDRETPAAIVLAKTEAHIQETVRLAVESGVPFVVKSGGHSTWSTIGANGFVLDLSEYWHLEVEESKEVAIIRGSVLSKQLSVALAEKGLFTAVGAGNSIGAIGYFLGGGTSPFNSLIGNGSDQIVAARMVDAAGRIIIVNEESELELLYAIRGAGQYFGAITELTIRGHPVSKLGNSNGTLWAGRFIFPLSRVEDIAVQMQHIANDSSHATSGMLLLMAPPPDRKACVVVSARYFGDPGNVDAAFQRLHDLKPLTAGGDSLRPQNMNDAHSATEVHGGYKRYGVVGLQEFEPRRFTEVARLWQKLFTECPDANNTSFNFQWDSRMSVKPFDSANSLHDTRLWQNNLLWYNQIQSQKAVDEHNNKANGDMRGSDVSKFVEFSNGTRDAPLEHRYRPQAKLEKLKALKQKWDPTGVFTTVLLD